MKNVIKKMFSFMLVLALVITIVPTANVKAADYAGDGGKVTINNVTKDNTLVGYKIIEIKYNSDNTVSYEWATGVAEAIKAMNNNTDMTVEGFAAIDDNEERQKLLSGVPSILTGTPDLTAQTPTVTGDALEGTVTWSDVPLGGYLIMPTSTTDVYQIMVAIVQPELDANDEYVTTSDTIAAKKTPIGIEKTVDDETTGDSKIVTYTIMADVPVYEDGAIDVTYIIGDKLSSGLTFDKNSLKVYGYTVARDSVSDSITATELGSLTPSTTYTGLYTGVEGDTVDSVAQTFVLTFNYDGTVNSGENLKTLGIKTIKIVYEAKLNDDAVIGSAGNLNKVKMEYTHYPFTENNHKYATDDEKVYTFQLDIDKVASGNNTKKLEGAEFEVYLKVEDSDTTIDSNKYPTTAYVTNATVSALPTGNFVNVGTITTDTDGKASLENLDAGTYYLVETKAPNGYTLPTSAFEVTIDKDGTDTNLDKTTYIYTKKIENYKGFVLPETGGTGTVIFTAVGVSLMLVAVVAFFVLRKKEMSKN